MHFSIQEFSKRTGLPPSKLRFYDKKGILKPSTRLENGYRAYSSEQIHDAKWIDSLRRADISIEDIIQYNQSNFKEKNQMLHDWQRELDSKIDELLAARKYIGGMKADYPQGVLLSKWEKPKTMIWQRFEVERKPHPFRERFVVAKSILEQHGIKNGEEVYVKTESVGGGTIVGEVGFEILDAGPLGDSTSLRTDWIPPTLFAILQNCHSDDAFLCFSYLQMVIRYGFQPSGSKLERYENIDAETYDFLIPLVK